MWLSSLLMGRAPCCAGNKNKDTARVEAWLDICLHPEGFASAADYKSKLQAKVDELDARACGNGEPLTLNGETHSTQRMC